MNYARAILPLAVAITALTMVACSDDSDTAEPTATPPGTPTTIAPTPENGRVLVKAFLFEDLFPLQSDFLGAVVRRDGLVSPCQGDIPQVVDGEAQITVMSDEEAAGCGGPGAEVILWAYVDGAKLYATEPIPWPTEGLTIVDVERTFSPATPNGAVPSLTEFSGPALTRDGSPLPAGRVVEAFIGNARCGVGSTRSGDFEGYILTVIADDSIPGCSPGAMIFFRIDGEPVRETATNTRDPEARGGELALTLQCLGSPCGSGQ